MSKSIKGVVYHVGYNESRGTKLYYIKLDNDKYYGWGEDEPKCKKGHKVSFNYSSYKDNGGTLRFKYEDGLKKIGTGEVPEYKGGGGAGGKSGGNSNWKGGSKGGGNWTAGSTTSAARGRSLEIAAEAARVAVELGVIKKPTAAQQKDGSAMDIYLDLLQQIADDYLAQILEAQIVGDKDGVEKYLASLAEEDEGDDEEYEDEDEDLDDEDYDEEDDSDEEDDDEESYDDDDEDEDYED